MADISQHPFLRLHTSICDVVIALTLQEALEGDKMLDAIIITIVNVVAGVVAYLFPVRHCSAITAFTVIETEAMVLSVLHHMSGQTKPNTHSIT